MADAPASQALAALTSRQRRRQRADQPGAIAKPSSSAKAASKARGKAGKGNGKGKGARKKLKKLRKAARGPIQLPPATSALPPWLLRVSTARAALGPERSLDAEMEDFATFSSATAGETAARAAVVVSVQHAARALRPPQPDARVAVFGSHATGLCGASSDIDVTVRGLPPPFPQPDAPGKRVHKALYSFVTALKSVGVKMSALEVVAKARVPLLRFTAIPSGVPVDISFNQASGESACETVRKYLAECAPFVRPLFFVVKTVLAHADLNDVSHSGLGSYTLFNMVVHHILRYTTRFPGRQRTCGDMLVDFFTLWGGSDDAAAIDVATTGVCIANGGFEYDRVAKFGQRRKNTAQPMPGLGVQDVDKDDNELGSNCGKIARVQQLFAACGAALRAWLQDRDHADGARHRTALSAIVHATEKMVERRAEVLAAEEEANGAVGLLQSVEDAWSIKAVREHQATRGKASVVSIVAESSDEAEGPDGDKHETRTGDGPDVVELDGEESDCEIAEDEAIELNA